MTGPGRLGTDGDGVNAHARHANGSQPADAPGDAALAPRMIQSMEILQMPIMDLQERIQQELDENPVLELKEPTADEVDRTSSRPSRRRRPRPRREGTGHRRRGNNELDFDRLDALSRDWDDHFNEEHRPSRNGMDEEGDRKHDAMQNMASRPQSLQDYLTDQLGFLDLRRRADPPGPARHHPHRRQRLPERAGRDRPGISEDARRPRVQAGPADPPPRADAGRDRRQLRRAGDGGARSRRRCRSVQKLDPPGVGARDLQGVPAAAADARDAAPRPGAPADPATTWRTSRTTACRSSSAATGFDIATIKEAIEVDQAPQPASRARSSPPRTSRTSCPDIAVERDEDGDVRRSGCWTTGCRTSTSASATSSCTRTRAATRRCAST